MNERLTLFVLTQRHRGAETQRKCGGVWDCGSIPCNFLSVPLWLRVSVLTVVLFVVSLFSARGDEGPTVTVGSKRFTENVILGEMVAHLARAAGAKVVHRSDLGGTPIVFKSLEEGSIDVYAEYTGTLSGDILGGQSVRTEQDLRSALASRGIRMSERLGFNNTYALGIKEQQAQQLGLTRISQLAEQPHLKLGFSEEFMNRPDGWPGLARRYGLPH